MRTGYAVKQAQGWTPSGRFSSLEDLEYGMQVYREQGGTNAVLANSSIETELAKLASVNFICPPEEARSASGGSIKWASMKS